MPRRRLFSNPIRKSYSNWFCRPLGLWTGFVFRSPAVVNDQSLKADLVFQGLQNPTSMAFLGPNDILVLEKDQGTVQKIVNGNMLTQPV